MNHRFASSPLALVLVLLGVSITGSLRAQTGLQASFDWSMPDRFGPDLRSLGGAARPDRIRDYWVTFGDTWSGIDADEPDGGSPAIHPGSWAVDLDAGGSRGDIVSYRWSVDGTEVASGASPRLRHPFPSEGEFEVALTVTDRLGNTARSTRKVTVQDWLIVAVGDSYASGEGNPELAGEWFEKIAAAQSEVEEARAELARAQQALKDAEVEYELTVDEIQPALRALNTWNAECPSISPACAAATANLTRELGKLGFREIPELISKGFQYVKTQIENLRRAAQAAVDVARARVEAAQAVVQGAQEEVDVLFREGAIWQERPDLAEPESHRSSLSGQALAALALERADPRTSVTFVHLAHSGARIVKSNQSSFLLSHAGEETDGLAQLDHVRRLVGDREIDALLVSIGGNDTGFADIITSLVLSDDQICGRLRSAAAARCEGILEGRGVPPVIAGAACAGVADRFQELCRERLAQVERIPKESHQELLEEGLAKLPERFDMLATYLRRGTKFPELPPSRLFFTEYPNLAEDDDGELCPDLATVTREDWRWVRDVMTTDLNRTIREEVTSHGWNLVEGIFDGFHGHGFCADDHWVVHPHESFLIQGDQMGTAHPTAAGHLVYGERIAMRLLGDLYRGGDIAQPRVPGYGPRFRRGDSNGDGLNDISDASHLLGWLFLGSVAPGCAASAEVNGDGIVDISDATFLLAFLFTGGSEPPAPFRECGRVEGEGEALACESLSEECR